MSLAFLRPVVLIWATGWAVAVNAEPYSPSVPDPPAAVTKAVPETLDDLRAFQTQTRAVLNKVLPSTVCLRVGSAFGSGVIVSKAGLVLTAGHVSGEPGRAVAVTLADGRVVQGKTLGLDRGPDSGMVQITTPGEWPFVELGSSKDLAPGQWCVATGHPGGYRSGRPPVVRVGRIGSAAADLIQTDCTLVGGDSGGPLFDMKGRLVGIHSRIGYSLATNMHVPVDAFRDSWDLLAAGERVGENPAWLGVRADDQAKDCKVGEITPKSPAEVAGLMAGDIITRFAGKEVKGFQDVLKLLTRTKPGDEVAVEVRRGEAAKSFKVTLGKRPA